MCGIAGIFNLTEQGDRTESLKRMCDSLRHRGPDDEGYFSDNGIGLGIRRLSIIDVRGGHQPISSEDENLWIVGNGEIYNFSSLREELVKRGHRFSTGSDIEVALHLFEQEGLSGVSRLNGMFALALWDKRRSQLSLIRDRLGIKPLYYYWDGKQLLFSSEIKALFASGLVPKKINRTAVWDYLTLRFIPQPTSIWQNVHKLLPGHTLTISAENPRPSIKSYWEIPHAPVPANGKSLHHYDQEFSDLFLEAVHSHLVSDVPVGVFLSGGLDSSALAAAIKETGRNGLDSFSIAFENSQATDERAFAREVAKWVGLNHHEVTLNRDDFINFLPDFVSYMDEPMADLASIPLYYVARAAARHIKVVMSGEGSDEILGGYHLDQVVRRWELTDWVRVLPQSIRQLLPFGQTLEQKPLVMTNFFSTEEKQKLFKEQITAQDTLDMVREQFRYVRNSEPLQQVLNVWSQSWLVEDILMKADRMTMANSIELRVPFLDHRLVEWSARLPSSLKIGRENGQLVTKRILRRFSTGRLPPAILKRPKLGFPVPAYEWLNGPLKKWSFGLLQAHDFRLEEWFVKKEIQAVLKKGTSGSACFRDQHRLWQLLILELWMRKWLS